MNRFARVVAGLSITIVLLSVSAAAQYARRVIRVQIPFEFTVSGRSMPAGDYTIVCLAPDRLELRDTQSHAFAWALTLPGESPEKNVSTTLEFSTVDGEHALTEVRVKNETTVYELAARPSPIAVALRQAHDLIHSAGAGNK